MSTVSIDNSPKSKLGAAKNIGGDARTSTGRRRKPVSTGAKMPTKTNEPPIDARVAKQKHVLALLSRPGGASIEELIHATDWQQHGVHGFLAGTVKKKLELVSSKSNGEARRYRIVTRRGR